MASRVPSIRIDVRDLSWAPGFHDVLHGISCPLGPAALIGVLGPSGAGKSSFLKLVNGCRREGSGSVHYGELDLRRSWDRIRPHVGYVPQDDIVHLELDPRQELLFAARLRMPALEETGRVRKVEAVLKLLDLQHVATTKIARLSGGQRKRVSMGVELLTEPPVLFLDEPTSGLDPALESRMMDVFQTLARQGRTVLVTTHVMESLDVLDRVLLLVRGRMAFFGPPKDCLAHFAVKSFPAVYDELSRAAPAEWQRRFRASPAWNEYVATVLATAPEALPAPVEAEASAPTPAGAEDVDDEFEALKREVGR